jgi:hypothetical protein
MYHGWNSIAFPRISAQGDSMFVRKSWIAILVCVLCHGGVAVAQRPDPALGPNWLNGALSTTAGGGSGDRTTFRDASGRSLGTAVQQGNRTIYRDSSGRTIGSADTAGSRSTSRDSSGRSTGSAIRDRK